MLKILQDRIEPFTIVRIDGDLDCTSKDDLRIVCEELYPDNIAIDLRRCGYMDSDGMGVIMGVARAAKESGCSMALISSANSNEGTNRIIHLAGLDRIIPTFPDEESMAEAFG